MDLKYRLIGRFGPGGVFYGPLGTRIQFHKGIVRILKERESSV